ncbi:MAG: hypothetical protein DRG31_01235 [Deltaproteobacteria bacterium]|nr:MAG: hypothetical protein DRG31_01235 [Deltaproteobacteria bacterium]
MVEQPDLGQAAVSFLRALGAFLKGEPLKATLALLWIFLLVVFLSAFWESLKELEPRAALLYGLLALGLGIMGFCLL